MNNDHQDSFLFKLYDLQLTDITLKLQILDFLAIE